MHSECTHMRDHPWALAVGRPFRMHVHACECSSMHRNARVWCASEGALEVPQQDGLDLVTLVT